MIQESFREYGIEFAHRNVTVYMPPDESAGEPDKKAAIAGAAAAAAAQAEEANENWRLNTGVLKITKATPTSRLFPTL